MSARAAAWASGGSSGISNTMPYRDDGRPPVAVATDDPRLLEAHEAGLDVGAPAPRPRPRGLRSGGRGRPEPVVQGERERIGERAELVRQREDEVADGVDLRHGAHRTDAG